MNIFERITACWRAAYVTWGAMKNIPVKRSGLLVAITDNKLTISVGSHNMSTTMLCMLSDQLESVVARDVMKDSDCQCPGCVALRSRLESKENSDQSMAEA